MTTLTITGNQGWTRSDINNAGGAHATVDVIDATTASWNARNTGSPQQEYPVRIRELPIRVQVLGGTINGLFDPSMDWGNLYGQGNSASVFLQDCPDGSSLKGWTIHGVVFDAFRVVGVDNWLVEGCRIGPAPGQEALPYGTRDDALEADQGFNGTVRNCLFEGLFTGISLGDANTPSSALNNTVLIENVLIKMGLWFDDIPNTHASPLKAAANTPKVLIKNSVFAISRADHSNLPRLTLAFSKLDAASSGNYWLNLTDNALPSDYPAIPASFAYLQGQAARDHWTAARDAFLSGGKPTGPKAEVSNVLQINPDTGVVRVETGEKFIGAVTIGASNASGTGTRDVTLTVV